jgi:hypothetical protein
VTGSRSSRKEKERRIKDSQRTRSFIGKVLGKSGNLGNLGKSGNPGISFRRTLAIQGSRGKELGGPPRKLGGA